MKKIQFMAAAAIMATIGRAQPTMQPYIEQAPLPIFTPVDKNLYPSNMTMVIQLLGDDGTPVDTCEVAAFVGTECRGTTRATNGLYYLIIAGEGAGQPMTLCTCLDGKTFTIDDTQQFVSDDILGTSWDPYVIDLKNRKESFVKGDANGDGTVNIVDVTTIISYILGTQPPSFVKEAADTNGDGKVDIIDVTTVIDIILK